MKELDIEMKNNDYNYSNYFSAALKSSGLLSPSDSTDDKFRPVKVMYDFPYTIVEFADGQKTCVRCHNEAYDYEKGLAMAIAKRVMTRADFDRLVESGKTFFESKMERIRKGKRSIEEKIL